MPDSARLAKQKLTCQRTYALQVGDVLYLPRGTVHQARAQTQASSHVTLSTYQRWTYGRLPCLHGQSRVTAQRLGTPAQTCSNCSSTNFLFPRDSPGLPELLHREQS